MLSPLIQYLIFLFVWSKRHYVTKIYLQRAGRTRIMDPSQILKEKKFNVKITDKFVTEQ